MRRHKVGGGCRRPVGARWARGVVDSGATRPSPGSCTGHARAVGCLLRARVEPYGDNSLDAVDVDLLAMACAHGHANVASLRGGWPGLLLACGKRLHRCCTSADSPLLGHEGQRLGGF